MSWNEIREEAQGMGEQEARLGLMRASRDAWVFSGYNPDTYRFYALGYDQTFSEMTYEERKQAALSPIPWVRMGTDWAASGALP